MLRDLNCWKRITCHIRNLAIKKATVFVYFNSCCLILCEFDINQTLTEFSIYIQN